MSLCYGAVSRKRCNEIAGSEAMADDICQLCGLKIETGKDHVIGPRLSGKFCQCFSGCGQKIGFGAD